MADEKTKMNWKDLKDFCNSLPEDVLHLSVDILIAGETGYYMATYAQIDEDLFPAIIV